jgi:hypothetical protein
VGLWRRKNEMSKGQKMPKGLCDQQNVAVPFLFFGGRPKIEEEFGKIFRGLNAKRTITKFGPKLKKQSRAALW